MKNKVSYTRHLDASTAFQGKITNDQLFILYECYQPVGSGPLGVMRNLCAVIEQLAKERGIELPPAKGL